MVEILGVAIMKEWFKLPIEGNLWRRLVAKWNNKRIDSLFLCRKCKKGSVVNRKGYFECPVCGHEYNGGSHEQIYRDC